MTTALLYERPMEEADILMVRQEDKKALKKYSG